MSEPRIALYVDGQEVSITNWTVNCERDNFSTVTVSGIIPWRFGVAPPEEAKPSRKTKIKIVARPKRKCRTASSAKES